MLPKEFHEPLAVRRFQQVNHLVDDHVFEQVLPVSSRVPYFRRIAARTVYCNFPTWSSSFGRKIAGDFHLFSVWLPFLDEDLGTTS
jgi:hypothetical protein